MNYKIMESSRKALPISLLTLIKALSQKRNFKPHEVCKIVRESQVQSSDIEPWSEYDHPVENSYGRQLVYQGDNFEIMVMSWVPGDFSGIHDHGYTQWGAVQIYGAAEHATFRVDNGVISTLDRWQVEPGEIIGVHHELIHQMGNPGNDNFLSLHVYGIEEERASITGDARIYDITLQKIQRVNGGVFFALPAHLIDREEKGPQGDFPTLIRYQLEYTKRVAKIFKHQGIERESIYKQALVDLNNPDHYLKLLKCLQRITDQQNHFVDSLYWRNLNRELKAFAKYQKQIQDEQLAGDSFHKYAEMYDALIGQPCLDEFMHGYLHHFKNHYSSKFETSTILSLGCGTGLVESLLINELGIAYDNLLGIDISPAMINEASSRIRAEFRDLFALDSSEKSWDIVFSGLNVFHYLDHSRIEEAIQKSAGLLKSGGWFVGDFITPDHIRWYPNVVYSGDKRIVSLRNPKLLERKGRMFQESEIINVKVDNHQIDVTYAGKHLRFLPPLHRIRTYFESAFKGEVHLLDAKTLELILPDADSCNSTRYVVFARKK